MCPRHRHNCKTGHFTSWKEREQPCPKINIARTKHEHLLFFIVKRLQVLVMKKRKKEKRLRVKEKQVRNRVDSSNQDLKKKPA